MASRVLDEERIFHTARKLPDSEAQAEYLDQIFAGDLALRERVEALLAGHEHDQQFLKVAAADPEVTTNHEPLTGAASQLGQRSSAFIRVT